MNRRYVSLLASVLSFVCVISILLLVLHLFDFVVFRHGVKLTVGIITVLSGYFSAFLKAFSMKSSNLRNEIIRKRLIFIFVFYIIMLVDFTLIDDTFGRNIFNVFLWDEDAFSDYIRESTNLVPFYTVKLFINGYKYGALTLFSVFENILGNFMVFMPLPFFAVCLFKMKDKWYTVFLSVLLAVLLVELLQFLFLTGSADIDDVILNVSGAMLLYGILKIKRVSRALNKFTFGVWEVVEK